MLTCKVLQGKLSFKSSSLAAVTRLRLIQVTTACPLWLSAASSTFPHLLAFWICYLAITICVFVSYKFIWMRIYFSHEKCNREALVSYRTFLASSILSDNLVQPSPFSPFWISHGTCLFLVHCFAFLSFLPINQAPTKSHTHINTHTNVLVISAQI